MSGTIAVVTGGGTGIGLMIASTLMSNGAKVYIVGPDQASLDKTCQVYNEAAKGKAGRGSMCGLEGDISHKDEAQRLAKQISDKEEYVTILFNNAGIIQGASSQPSATTADAFVHAYFDTVKPEHFDNVLRTNAVGPYWMTFAFLPLLEKWRLAGESGHVSARRFPPQVIMTSSMNGWTKDPVTGGMCFPYLFSKSAIGHAVASLAHELIPLGIRVNGIAPGWFDTEMTHPGTADENGVSTAKDTGFQVPFKIPISSRPGYGGHGGSPQDIGAVVLALVTNWFINGETILVDGGTLLKHPSSY